MNMRRVFVASMAVATAMAAGPDAHERPSAEVVIEWNQIVQNTIPGAGGVLAPRSYSMVHIAMFDAVNAIERDYSPFRVALRERGRGSSEAAAAQAAHDVLIGLNPAATATYDAALEAQLGTRPTEFARRGAAIGARVAKEILTWRQEDGWIVAGLPPYVEPALPGRWQPTPPNNPAAAFTHLQRATPMALLTPTQYLPPPPPQLTSAAYATDLLEVQALGRFDSTARTPEQTQIARFWASVSADGAGTATHNFAIWNNITRDAVRERRLSLVDGARVFALVNVSIHDGLHTTQASKFVYGLWRPVTAIRGALDDSQPGDGTGCRVAAVDYDATVPVVRGQHGLYRRQRRARPAARVRHRRHGNYGHLETVERHRMSRTSSTASRHWPTRSTWRGSGAASTTASIRWPASASETRWRNTCS